MDKIQQKINNREIYEVYWHQDEDNEYFKHFWNKLKTHEISDEEWEIIEKSYKHHEKNENKCSTCSPQGRSKPWKCVIWLIYSEFYGQVMERKGAVLTKNKDEKGNLGQGTHWCFKPDNCDHVFKFTTDISAITLY